MTTAHIRNTGQVTPGNSITFDIYFRTYSGGPLTNADYLPTVTIKDPNGNLIITGLATLINTGHYEYTFTCPSISLISSDYRIDWIALINGVMVPDTWEVFSVISPTSTSQSQIIISDDWLAQIKKVIAFPKVDELFLTDNEIKSYSLFPAMQEYFTKFPIKTAYSTPFSDEVHIPFPDEFTLGVTHVAIVDTGLAVGTGTSFWDLVAFQSLGGAAGAQGAGSFGKRGYNPNSLYQERLLQRMAIKSYQNTYMTAKWRINHQTKELIAYASSAGTLAITWASYSNNFDNDVLYTRKLDVVQLAQANLLDHLCDVSGMIVDSALDQQINVADLRTRATDLRDKIIDKWDDEAISITLLHPM